MSLPESVYWDQEEGCLVGKYRSKVKEFLRNGLVEPVRGHADLFYVRPAKGRSLVHLVDVQLNSCSCQRAKMGHVDCSHRGAVFLMLKNESLQVLQSCGVVNV